MTIEHKTPQARKEALAYCRRCLAVMLCCVLVFGLTFQAAPKAEASAAALAIAGDTASSALAAGSIPGVGSALLTVTVSALGVDFMNGVYNQDDGSALVSAGAYQVGYDLEQWLETRVAVGAPAAYNWYQDTLSRLRGEGGLAPGTSIEVPTEVAEELRQWVTESYDFSDGVISYENYMMAGENGASLVLSNVDVSGVTNWSTSGSRFLNGKFQQVGTLIRPPAPPSYASDWSYTFTAGDLYFTATYDITAREDGAYNYNYSLDSSFGQVWGASGSKFSSIDAVATGLDRSLANTSYYTPFYVPALDRIYLGVYVPSTAPACAFRNTAFVKQAEAPAATATVLTPTAALDEPITKPLVITIPVAMPTTEVDGYTVPVITELAATDVLNPGKDDTDDPGIEGSGSLPWEKVKDWLEQWGQGTRDLINGRVDALEEEMSQNQDLIKGKVDALPDTVAKTVADALDQSLADALPATGSAVGDNVLDEVANDPEGLGAVIITKFPFSIPWDVVKAIKLLAVPPTPPKFEVDMYSAMDGYGGFHAPAPVVIDFEPLEPAAAIVRWASTIGFIYCLAMGTKKLLWTA